MTNKKGSKAKTMKKSSISVNTAKMEPEKVEFTVNRQEKPIIKQNEPQEFVSEHVAPTDSPIVRAFWRQKEKVWKEEKLLQKDDL